MKIKRESALDTRNLPRYSIRMQTKLTLSIEKEVIQKAKRYAQKRQESISSLVEAYFRALTSEDAEKSDEIPPITRELAGTLEGVQIDTWKKERMDRLTRKHLR